MPSILMGISFALAVVLISAAKPTFVDLFFYMHVHSVDNQCLFIYESFSTVGAG